MFLIIFLWFFMEGEIKLKLVISLFIFKRLEYLCCVCFSIFGWRICLKFFNFLVDIIGIRLLVWGMVILIWILLEYLLFVIFVKEIFVIIFWEFMWWGLCGVYSLFFLFIFIWGLVDFRFNLLWLLIVCVIYCIWVFGIKYELFKVMRLVFVKKELLVRFLELLFIC